jgi:hypothetical protein
LREKARLREENEAKELEMAGGGRWNEVGRKADMNRIDSLYYMGVQRYRNQCSEAMNEKSSPPSPPNSGGDDEGVHYHDEYYEGEEEEEEHNNARRFNIVEKQVNSNYHRSSKHFTAKSKNNGRTSSVGDAYGVESSPSKQFKAKPLPKAIYGSDPAVDKGENI